MLLLLILKYKTGKRKGEKLNKLKCVQKKQIFIKCQENAWCNTELFKYWIKNIFFKYQKLTVKRIFTFIFNKATSHINNDIIKYLEENKVIIIIPPGLTSFLQLLNIWINKIFKLALRKQTSKKENLTSICENKFNINNEDSIKMILDIWNNKTT